MPTLLLGRKHNISPYFNLPSMVYIYMLVEYDYYHHTHY